jgi:hypothetical protein
MFKIVFALTVSWPKLMFGVKLPRSEVDCRQKELV